MGGARKRNCAPEAASDGRRVSRGRLTKSQLLAKDLPPGPDAATTSMPAPVGSQGSVMPASHHPLFVLMALDFDDPVPVRSARTPQSPDGPRDYTLSSRSRRTVMKDDNRSLCAMRPVGSIYPCVAQLLS